MAGFNHPKGQGLCCFHTLSQPLQRELIDAGLTALPGVRVFVDPDMPSGVVKVVQNGKVVGSIINIGSEGGCDER